MGERMEAVVSIRWMAKKGFQRLPCGHTVPKGHAVIPVGEILCCSEMCARKVEAEPPRPDTGSTEP